MSTKGLRDMRIEHDALGAVEVPLLALHGAQTQRAVLNFPISGTTLGDFPELIRALARVKKAAATVNSRLGHLAEVKADTIVRVCDEIISGEHHEHFPVDVFQGGAGTSSNMNVNEVIANRGLAMLGHAYGEYGHLHPNDDVNRSQSTNDVYPTAVRLALMEALPDLCRALAALSDGFQERGEAFAHVRKLGRTELQDAVPMTLGAEFSAFASTIREDVARLQDLLPLLSEVNLGGTAIGTGVATPPGYHPAVVTELGSLTGMRLLPSSDLIEASWDVGVFVHVSGVMKRAATKLSKIANDLRLLSSGPRGGLGEIRLAPMQPGSSLMPGKVNPVIPEMVNQVAFHVIGSDVTISFAAEGGQLQLNAFEPLIAFSLLRSVALLRNAALVFRTHCVDRIEADEERCTQNLEASTANFAELVPSLGYERASRLAKDMLAKGMNWSEVSPTMALETTS